MTLKFHFSNYDRFRVLVFAPFYLVLKEVLKRILQPQTSREDTGIFNGFEGTWLFAFSILAIIILFKLTHPYISIDENHIRVHRFFLWDTVISKNEVINMELLQREEVIEVYTGGIHRLLLSRLQKPDREKLLNSLSEDFKIKMSY